LLAGVVAAPKTVSFPIEDGGEVYADVYGEGNRGIVLAHGGLIVARDDVSDGIRAQYEKAAEPKELIILDGYAHARLGKVAGGNGFGAPTVYAGTHANIDNLFFLESGAYFRANCCVRLVFFL
jgi:hypothetical protein